MSKFEQFLADTRAHFGVELKAKNLDEAKKELASMREELEKKNTRATNLSPPETLNEEERTVDCIIATELPVIRFDWREWEYYDEILLVEGCDLNAVKDGIPFIDGHKWHGGVKAVLGTTVNLRIEGDKLIGTRVFANTDAANEAFELIKDGHLKKQSLGYQIEQLVKLKPGETKNVLGKEVTNDGKRIVAYATKWQALEDSAVIIPADKNTGVKNNNEQNILTRTFNLDNDSQTNQTEQRSDEEMNTNNIETGVGNTVTEQQVDLTAERQAAAEAATARSIEIIELCRQHQISDEMRDGFISSNQDLNEVRQAVLNELVSRTANQPAPGAGVITMGRDHIENVQPLMRDALLIGGGLLNRSNAVEGFNDYTGMSARDFCIAYLEERGESVKRNISSHDLQKRLMATTDFPMLLETVGIAGVQAGFDESAETYETFSDMTGNLPNLNPSFVARATEYLELDETDEGEESKYAYFGEVGSYVQLKKYTKAVMFTEEVIINDQLGEFVKALGNHGKAVSRLEGKMAYGWLTSPPTVDGKAFFHSDWGNVAGTGSALSEESIGEALTAMATQTEPAGDGSVRPIYISGEYLVVPKKYEMAAKKILMSQVYTDSSPASTQYNTIRDAGLKLVSDRRLDAFYKGSTHPWFILGQKGTNVRFFFLNGQRNPIVDRAVDVMRDIITVRIKHRVGSAAGSNLAFYKNGGAS